MRAHAKSVNTLTTQSNLHRKTKFHIATKNELGVKAFTLSLLYLDLHTQRVFKERAGGNMTQHGLKYSTFIPLNTYYFIYYNIDIKERRAKPMNKKEITYEEIREEVIERQARFGSEEDPDICINKTFNGLTLNSMCTLINNWPECNCGNGHAILLIEYNRPEEMTMHLIDIVNTMRENK